jgi:hypothetical protein
MKKSIVKIITLALIFLLISLTVQQEPYFLQLDKKSFMKDELITGKAYINTDVMKTISSTKDAGYCAFDDEYNLISNAIQLRILSGKEQNSWDGYTTIQNALTVKHDTAFLSFKVPQSLKKNKTQKLEIKVSRQWTVRGRDTTFVVLKQFEIF